MLDIDNGMEFDTISINKETSRYVRCQDLIHTSKLSYSTCIDTRSTGMPGDGGQNTFDISMYRNFDIDTSIY